MSFLYKYIGPATLDQLFDKPEHFTVKCSLPKNFNDPYELFLTLNFQEDPDALAFYADIVGELPQVLTTCFSRSPAVVPMWAHYAQNLEGFAIEVDEEGLSKAFPESNFGDVDYMDAPRKELSDRLHQALMTLKPRHVHFLRRAVFSSSYYTKTTCWSYENERRMVVNEAEVRDVDGMSLLDVPVSCLKGMIAGPRASIELQEKLRAKAVQIGCNFFQLNIGRSSATPYFISNDGQCYVFDGGGLKLADNSCCKCNEPIDLDINECSWCQITDAHRLDAARRNPYRMLSHYGLLDSYIEGVVAIDREIARKRRESE